MRWGYASAFAAMVALTASVPGFSNVAAAQTGKLEKPNVTLLIGGVSGQMYFLPVVLAERLGYFKEAGLQLNKIDTGSGAKALQALIGGSADVAAGSFEHPIRMNARGRPIRAFVKFGRFHGNVLGIVTHRMKDYKTPADMKGWKIGISAPGSSSHLFAGLLLQKYGLKNEDVSFVAVTQGPGAVAAVRTGKELDAVALTDPVITELASTNDITVVADSRNLEGTKEVYGGETISGVLYTTADFLKQNPNTAQAMTNAVVRALKWMKTASVDDIAAKVPDFQAGKPDLYKAMVEKNITSFHHDGTFAPEAVQVTLDFLRKTDAEMKDAKVDLSKTYDNTFAEKAKTQVAK
ncbi:MAG: ABC transporter substrate-binding protein [Variibacter sp.]